MISPGLLWVPPDTPVLPATKRTISYGIVARDLKAYGETNGQTFVVLVQGNHHETFERMALDLGGDFTYASPPAPAYRDVPFGLIATVDFERTFLGSPATIKNTLIPKQQGRFGYGVTGMALNRYHSRHGQKDFSDVEPNLRWRVLDDEREFIRQDNPVDYDVTASDIVQSIKDAVTRAGGPEKVGSLYLCSPNNPTGRRLTEQEYHGIRDYVVEVNKIRVSKGLGKLIIICDDPYFEACDIRHRDPARAATGKDPYLAINYGPLAEENPLAPVVFLHSLSKFAEQAGANGATIMVSTDPEFTGHIKDAMSVFGGLAYSEEYLEAMGRFFHSSRAAALLNRCEQAGRVFITNSAIMDEEIGEDVLNGDPNMVKCFRVPKKDFVGAKIVYPGGKEYTLQDEGDLATHMANFFGVGCAPELDDKTIPSEGYDSENEVLLRFALNQPPGLMRLGAQRAARGIQEISRHLRAGKVLQYNPSGSGLEQDAPRPP